MKKFIAGMICGAALMFSTSVLASGAYEQITAYLDHSISVQLDGKKVELANTPVNFDGSTYLPLRELAGVVGLSVDWDEGSKTAKLSTKQSPSGQSLSYQTGVPAPAPALANTFTKSNYKVLVNDIQTTPETFGTRKDVLLLPVRFLAEALGAEVSWNETTRGLTFRSGSNSLVVILDSTNVTWNGNSMQLPEKASIIDGVSMIPARFVIEIFGGSLTVDDPNKTVKITKPYVQVSPPAVQNPPVSTSPNQPATTPGSPAGAQAELTYLEKNNPYVYSGNGLTVTMKSMQIMDKGGYSEITINYFQKNDTADKAIDEATFKIYYQDGSSEPQYGFFDKLYPGDSVNRTYTFKALKSQIPLCVEYGTDVFFSSSPSKDTLKWKVQ